MSGEIVRDELVERYEHDHPLWATLKPFFNGGSAGMLSCCLVQPLDTLKVRMQLGDQLGGPAAVARRMVVGEGIGSLYSGLSAGLMRQATYTTARLGIYNSLNSRLQSDFGDKPIPFYDKVGCALIAGSLGAVIGNPADLAQIRMQADGAAPAHQRLNFKHVFDAMSHIVRDGKGPLALWQGVGPTVTRSMALNAGQLLTNDIARSALGKGSGGLGLDQSVAVFGASFLAGTAGAALSLPFDLVKTRIQRMPPPAPGEAPLYTGALDCAWKTLKAGGPRAFYVGFFPYLGRQLPHAVFTLVFMSQLARVELLVEHELEDRIEHAEPEAFNCRSFPEEQRGGVFFDQVFH